MSVDGRDLPPLPRALENEMAPAHAVDDALVLIDSYEHMAALDPHLRRVVLPSLPEGTRAVIAGRRPADRAWFEGGWERFVHEMEG